MSDVSNANFFSSNTKKPRWIDAALGTNSLHVFTSGLVEARVSLGIQMGWTA